MDPAERTGALNIGDGPIASLLLLVLEVLCAVAVLGYAASVCASGGRKNQDLDEAKTVDITENPLYKGTQVAQQSATMPTVSRKPTFAICVVTNNIQC